MTAEQLISLLELVKPNTELGIASGFKQMPLKSMMVSNNILYLTTGNWAPTQEQANSFDNNCILSSISHFIKPSEYDRGYQDGLKANLNKNEDN